jgi:CubicO group peptidase (beta-lactamase class C family)
VLFNGGYGLADRERKLANKLDTRFRIGSMNKMFTAVAVLQLAQAGRIGLTDPVARSRSPCQSIRRPYRFHLNRHGCGE